MAQVIPQYSDFSIVFAGLTKNGDTFSIPDEVEEWHLAVTRSSVTGTPLFVKVADALATGVTASSYVVNTGTNTVSVQILASSDLSFQAGTYYAALFAKTSGLYITHRAEKFTIEPQVRFYP